MAQLFTRLLLATEQSEFDEGAEAIAPQIAARAEREAAVKIVELRQQALAVGVAIDLRLVSVVVADALRAPADAFVAEMLIQAHALGVVAQAEVRVGKPFNEILAARAACDADLIVMGSRGEPGIGRALLGGVAQKVMGLSEHPVLVLHS